jgi:citrate synthase
MVMTRSDATTEICTYDATRICVRGINLCEELIGKISITDYICLLVLGTQPNDAQRSIIEAAIVALAEHGMTPSVMAARLTYMGAPESLQGAVAAGLLGVGDQFVGTVELVAPILTEICCSPLGPKDAAANVVARHREAKTLVPGFGQPHHKPDDPRSPALFAVGRKVGVDGAYINALSVLGEEVDRAANRHLTINAPAAISALFLELGLPVRIMRGFVIIARCIGLVGHLAEEQVNPAGRALWEAGAHAVAFAGKPVP